MHHQCCLNMEALSQHYSLLCCSERLRCFCIFFRDNKLSGIVCRICPAFDLIIFQVFFMFILILSDMVDLFIEQPLGVHQLTFLVVTETSLIFIMNIITFKTLSCAHNGTASSNQHYISLKIEWFWRCTKRKLCTHSSKLDIIAAILIVLK